MDEDKSPRATVPVGDGSSTADIDEQRELFVLLISAIGTPVNQVQTDLEAAFRAVGYAPRSVRISELLDATATSARPADTCQTEWLMDLGDKLREESGVQGAAAMLAVLKIRADRAAENHADEGDNIDRRGAVTIIRSAKRAEEVDFLRNIYGSRLLVIGISQAEEKRREALAARLGRERDESGGVSNAALADRLLRRDEDDPDNDWGQSLQGIRPRRRLPLDSLRSQDSRPSDPPCRTLVPAAVHHADPGRAGDVPRQRVAVPVRCRWSSGRRGRHR